MTTSHDAGREAIARAILDGWYEGNEEWDSPRNDMLQTRAYWAADAVLALTRPPAQAGAASGEALRDVAAERARQMSVEGWSLEHDDRHNDRSLATAAACYTMFAAATDEARNTTDLPDSLASLGKPLRGWAAFLQIWPWDRKWWKPKSRRADLVRAAALIIAEIERLDRKEAARG